MTASIAMMEVLKARGVKPDVAAGLSLGEYCALVAAGVMSADDAISTVRQRGILMQEAVPVGEGAMAAILALDASAIEEVTGPMEDVWIANYSRLSAGNNNLAERRLWKRPVRSLRPREPSGRCCSTSAGRSTPGC